MTLSGKLVQVTRPTTENSLAECAVGVAWAVAEMGIDGIDTTGVDMYLLESESPADQEKVAGLLFFEGALAPKGENGRHPMTVIDFGWRFGRLLLGLLIHDSHFLTGICSPG